MPSGNTYDQKFLSTYECKSIILSIAPEAHTYLNDLQFFTDILSLNHKSFSTVMVEPSALAATSQKALSVS